VIDSGTLHGATAESIHFCRPGELDAIRGQLASLRVVVVRSAIASETDLFDALGAALEFPDYFGRNWDALDESLRDLGWLDISAGLVVVIENAERLWTTRPFIAGQLVELWLTAAEEWRVAEVPFHLVFAW
jgi:RNAse (barnase) inhibitor barstar